MPARLASKTFACDATVISERSLLQANPSMSERRELSIWHGGVSEILYVRRFTELAVG